MPARRLVARGLLWPWGSPLREALAWGRQGHLRGTSPLQGSHCRCEGGDLCREGSD